MIHVNHRLNRYKRKTRKLLLSEEGLMHRSRRPIEPEAVFGQIKFNKQYRRFRHRGLDKVKMDFALLAMSFNIHKLWRNLAKKTTNAPTGTSDSNYGAYKVNIRPNLKKYVNENVQGSRWWLEKRRERVKALNGLLTRPPYSYGCNCNRLSR